MAFDPYSVITSWLAFMSSAKAVLWFTGFAIVVTILFAYIVYGAYKFGHFLFGLTPHKFALVMVAIGFGLIILSTFTP